MKASAEWTASASSRRNAGILPDIRQLTLEELQPILIEAGQPSFRARQIMRWLWTAGAESFDAMRDLPIPLRAWLDERFAISIPSATAANSADDTRKLLLNLTDHEAIESVIIPADDRITLCLSTQAGCAMGCEFCATARMGLHRNLTAAEIAAQIPAARRELHIGERLTNFVFMGMGEPLAN
ncbi:MAG: 23S rRNA (adenine(2503)-C(2))-methyltransferase RlmN, partial [Candidatus Binataceae bacterium]